MGYLGRRIGLSQDKAGPSSPAGEDGAVGGGILDLFASGYFQRQGNIYNAPGTVEQGMVASGGVINDYLDPTPGTIYRTHLFTSSGTFEVTTLSDSFPNAVDYLVIGGGGGGGGENMGTLSGTGRAGGGGGAGGYRTSMPEGPGGPSPSAESTLTASVASYTITVGAGGAGGGPTPHSVNPGSGQGSFSNFGHPTPIRSEGGGAGIMQPQPLVVRVLRVVVVLVLPQAPGPVVLQIGLLEPPEVLHQIKDMRVVMDMDFLQVTLDLVVAAVVPVVLDRMGRKWTSSRCWWIWWCRKSKCNYWNISYKSRWWCCW